MKIKMFLLLAIFIAGTVSVSGQDCKMFYPIEEGTELEYKDYNEKDKLNGSSIQKVISKEELADGLKLLIEHQSFDKKGEKLGDNEFEIRCENGVFYMDMKNFLDDDAFAAYENMEMEIDAKDMEFPDNIVAGSTLPDANITAKVNSGGMTMLSITVWITNRKIEGQESITTPAGTFDCFKMTYDMETKMMMKIQAKGVQWIAEDVGMVRTETFNKKGKPQGYTVLTNLKQ